MPSVDVFGLINAEIEVVLSVKALRVSIFSVSKHAQYRSV
jgi:hypothetical protein